jgi:hypothetical protein
MSSNVGKLLEPWLLKQKAKDFPGRGAKVDYLKQFENATQHLRKQVHPEVEKGAAINDVDRDMFLNNHGTDHVEAVINRASEILTAANCTLTPYEGYLFLLAAHLHDTGNLFGRAQHEQGCREIMKRLGTRVGDDELEKKIITDIAAAHGGRTETGNRDTISSLLPQPTIKLLNADVRVQFLAALLRFADELADDRSRASRFALDAGAIPDASKLYHHYSQSLHSVTIAEREVKLDFDLSETVATSTYTKGEAQVYLLDEIFHRTVKMHTERMYCMRFMRPFVRLDEIRVNIEVYEVVDGRYGRRREQLAYRLAETGYPGSPARGIHELCPETDGWSGEVLRNRLVQAQGAAQ